MISLEELKNLLSYDPDTGVFHWLKRRRGVRKNLEAGNKNDGYIIIRIFGKNYYAHRLAWFYVTGEWPKEQIDHENKDGFDNRWDNLRELNNRKNNLNKHKQPKSGFHGVVQVSKNSFRSQGKLNGKQCYFGHFKTPEEAYQAYVENCHINTKSV